MSEMRNADPGVKTNTWAAAFRMCVKHAPELLCHVFVQLLLRVPLCYFLCRLARSLLSTGAAAPEMILMPVCTAVYFVLILLPARFAFGEILRKWADEYRTEEKCSSGVRALGESILNALRRFHIYLLAGLKRILKGAAALPWIALAVCIFLYMRFVNTQFDSKNANPIISGIPMWLAGKDSGFTRYMANGILLRFLWIGCCAALAFLCWQSVNGAEYRIQPKEKICGMQGVFGVYVTLTNALLDAASLALPAYFLFSYAYSHYADLFNKQYDLMFRITMVKELLKDPLKDIGTLLLKLVLCAVFIYLPLRVFRRARGAAFVSFDTARGAENNRMSEEA